MTPCYRFLPFIYVLFLLAAPSIAADSSPEDIKLSFPFFESSLGVDLIDELMVGYFSNFKGSGLAFQHLYLFIAIIYGYNIALSVPTSHS